MASRRCSIACLAWLSACGKFGYLDYRLPYAWYALVSLPTFAELVTVLRRPRAVSRRSPWYALLLFAVYATLSWRCRCCWSESIGLVLQGRYFLPAGLAVPLLALAAGRWPARAQLALVAVGVAWAWHLSVLRYYADGWTGSLRRCPGSTEAAARPHAKKMPRRSGRYRLASARGCRRSCSDGSTGRAPSALAPPAAARGARKQAVSSSSRMQPVVTRAISESGWMRCPMSMSGT